MSTPMPQPKPTRYETLISLVLAISEVRLIVSSAAVVAARICGNDWSRVNPDLTPNGTVRPTCPEADALNKLRWDHYRAVDVAVKLVVSVGNWLDDLAAKYGRANSPGEWTEQLVDDLRRPSPQLVIECSATALRQIAANLRTREDILARLAQYIQPEERPTQQPGDGDATAEPPQPANNAAEQLVLQHAGFHFVFEKKQPYHFARAMWPPGRAARTAKELAEELMSDTLGPEGWARDLASKVNRVLESADIVAERLTVTRLTHEPMVMWK